MSLSVPFLLRVFPQLDLQLESHWFHFQIVSFISLVALVLGLFIMRLTVSIADVRTLFVTMAFTAISGIFLTHGIATPGALVAMPDPKAVASGHMHFFARPDLVVGWAAPFSLTVGALLFALASVAWSPRAAQWILNRRTALWQAGIFFYLFYLTIILFAPQPLELLAQSAPLSRYALAAIPFLLYALAAWRNWGTYQASGRAFDAALTIAAGLLAEAVLLMVTMPLWYLSWWLYHVLMLIAFGVAMGAVLREYEQVRHFQLTQYFAATSVIVIALLTLIGSELATDVLGSIVNPEQTQFLRWSIASLLAGMSGVLFIILLVIVRRGDQLLTERTAALQKQQTALERGRIAEALVPIGLAIGATLDLDQVLDIICKESLRLFNVDTTLLWSKEEDELVARAAYGYNREGFIGMRQPLQHNSLLGARVVRERKPLLVNHAERGEGVSSALVARFNIQSIMGVPLFGEDQVLGALVLIDTQDPERFGELDLEIARIFGQQAATALTHARLYKRIQKQADALALALDELRGSYRTTLTALSAAIDARDHETEGHSQRVTVYALTIARELGIQDDTTLEALERGALLHDVGKIGVPDSILHKPGALTEAEWCIMRQHPEIGYAILSEVAFLQSALPIVLHHHERWDGRGYPDRLAGESIPVAARIFAVADTLDAITSARPYRAARSFAEARAEILRHRGTQFDPSVVDAFTRVPEFAWRSAAQSILIESFPINDMISAEVLAPRSA